MDLTPEIADYASYLESHGYTRKTIVLRLQHLSCLQRFVDARELKTLEEFDPQLASDFIDFWVAYQPGARPSRGATTSRDLNSATTCPSNIACAVSSAGHIPQDVSNAILSL